MNIRVQERKLIRKRERKNLDNMSGRLTCVLSATCSISRIWWMMMDVSV